MNTNIKIFLSVLGLLILGGIGAFIMDSASPSVPNKYDSFAQALKDKGATFYGAFWCPHCKSEKKLFGDSVKLLPYVECSTPDASAQTQICIDKKIESYPTWTFSSPIKVTAESEPTICTKDPGLAGEDSICERTRSAYATIWIFPKFQISSEAQPTHVGNEWSFGPDAQMRGEISLEELARQIGFTLPE